MKNKKITIEVGIPVFNESKNIINLLNSIFSQKGNFDLKTVYVLNDASTDDTKTIVKKMMKAQPVIKLIDDGKRQGKNKRLETFYKRAQSEIIFIFDGDVVLKDENVFENVIRYFYETDVALVGCNKIPVKAENFIGNIINTLDEIWYESRVDINEGINIYNLSSCAFAVKTNFVKKLSSRVGLLSETEYLYFNIKKKNLKARFAKKASIYFRNPDNVQDYMLQKTRFDGSTISGENYGGWAQASYQVSTLNKIKGTLKILYKKPLMAIAAVLFRYVVRFFPYQTDPLVKKGIWQTVQSSKKAINI